MSLSPLSTKIIFGIVAGTATAGTIVGSAFGLGWEPFSDKNTTVYLVSETTSITSVSSAPVDTTKLNSEKNRNYFCQVGEDVNKKDETCTIKELDLESDNKRVVDLKAGIKTKNKDVTVSDVKTQKKYFEIVVKDDFYHKLVESRETKLNVFHNLKNVNTNIGSLKVLFATKGGKALGKTSYAVGKITGFRNSAVQKTTSGIASNLSGKTFTCKFPANTTNGLVCKIHNIASSGDVDNLSNITSFTWNNSVSTSISKDKFYIFKYDSSATKNVSDFVSSKGTIESSGTITVGGDSNISTIDIDNLQPSVIVEDTSSSYLFLL